MQGIITPLKIQDSPVESKQDRPSTRTEKNTRTDLSDFISLLLALEQKTAAETAGKEASLRSGTSQGEEISTPDLTAGSSGKTAGRQDIPSAQENDIAVDSPFSQAESGSWEAVFPGRSGKSDTLVSEAHHPGMPSQEGDIPVWLRPDPAGAADQVPLPPSPATGNPSSVNGHFPVPNATAREGVTVEPGYLSTGEGTGVDPNHVLEQISGKIISFIRRGGGTGRPEEQVMRISLHPESLGRIEVKISMTDNQVNTSIVTETAIAKELIDSQQQSLRSALLEHGLKMNDLMVAVGQQTADGNRQAASYPNFSGDHGRREIERENGRDVNRSHPGLWESGIPAYDTQGLVNLFA